MIKGRNAVKRKGPDKYVATAPQIFDLWQDPQERYDIFMNNYTEHASTLVMFNQAVHDLMQTYVKYPPRKPRSESLHGANHALGLRALSVGARQAEGRRLRPPAAERELGVAFAAASQPVRRG